MTRQLDKSKVETRAYAIDGLDIRSESEPRIKGHAAVFDKWSDDLGGFKERIAPGAFTKTLLESDVRMLWDHNSQYVLGRKSSGTLQLMEDPQGLYFENIPPATRWFEDLSVSMRRGDISQMSFGFQVIRDEWNEGYTRRVLHEVRLVEISVVTFPAYPQTAAKVRALPNGMDADRIIDIARRKAEGAGVSDVESDEIRFAAEYLSTLFASEPPSGHPEPAPPAGRADEDRGVTRAHVLADLAMIEAGTAFIGG